MLNTIFILKNNNGKVFVTEDTVNGVEDLIQELNNKKHWNKHLQSSWNKYGAEQFTFETLEQVETEALTERVQYWINYYNSTDSKSGYNIAPKKTKEVAAEEA